MTRILVLMNVFFNYDYTERTLLSLFQNKGNFTLDIIFLENPSKYSEEIRELSIKYHLKHFIGNENIAGQIFQLFYSNNKSLFDDYDYVCITESDVVLDDGCISEALCILDKLPNAGHCCTALNLGLEKYKPIREKIARWVPKPIRKGFYAIGHTGVQFLIFRKPYFEKLMSWLDQDKLREPITGGCNKYTGLSDSNIRRFNDLNSFLSVQTVVNKLDHIGWEVALGMNKEYKQVKQDNLRTKKIRQNRDLHDYHLTCY